MTYVNARISKIVVPLYGSESAMEAADGMVAIPTSQPKEMTDYSTRKILHQSFMNLTNNQVSFMTLRKYHYNVNRQSEMR
jgi:hypothetical protein